MHCSEILETCGFRIPPLCYLPFNEIFFVLLTIFTALTINWSWKHAFKKKYPIQHRNRIVHANIPQFLKENKLFKSNKTNVVHNSLPHPSRSTGWPSTYLSRNRFAVFRSASISCGYSMAICSNSSLLISAVVM